MPGWEIPGLLAASPGGGGGRQKVVSWLDKAGGCAYSMGKRYFGGGGGGIWAAVPQRSRPIASAQTEMGHVHNAVIITNSSPHP